MTTTFDLYQKITVKPVVVGRYLSDNASIEIIR